MIVSDSDLTGEPLFPGHGITCVPLDLTTAARAARAAYNLLKYAEELLP